MGYRLNGFSLRGFWFSLQLGSNRTSFILVTKVVLNSFSSSLSPRLKDSSFAIVFMYCSLVYAVNF